MTRREPLPADLFDEVCPSPLLPFRFGDKWGALVLRCLEDGPRRFSELRVPLHRVTPKVLTQSLRGLERGGLIVRTEYEAPRRAVEYALTPLGRSMLGPMRAACAWAADHWDELLDAHESYESRESHGSHESRESHGSHEPYGEAVGGRRRGVGMGRRG
ncbi:winged helix-turn-helix transcriptional regulator [Streptomyces buecherae]|uniref:winged helix-turn-helix transcriptional regulator n=1 Tax=Streptomyces buecherae TaxID=2763006 RepID=UPI001E2AFBC8|nr:helix-turn-helix domain-containing protein [Streptomyces buecherae]